MHFCPDIWKFIVKWKLGKKQTLQNRDKMFCQFCFLCFQTSKETGQGQNQLNEI